MRVGYESPHHFLRLHRALILGDQQVDEVVGIGQPFAVKLQDRYPPIELQRADVLPGLLDACRVRMETLNQATPTSTQGHSQPAVTATKVDDEPAADACFGENLTSRIPRFSVRCFSAEARQTRLAASEDDRQETGYVPMVVGRHDRFSSILQTFESRAPCANLVGRVLSPVCSATGRSARPTLAAALPRQETWRRENEWLFRFWVQESLF